MKARIPKSKKEDSTNASVNSRDFRVELSKLTEIDQKIQNQFNEMVNEFGTERRYDIISYMRKSHFINLFSPATPLVRNRIKESVSKLGEKIIIDDIDHTIQKLQAEYKFPLEKVLDKMKLGQFEERMRKIVPPDLGNIAEQATIKYIEIKTKELELIRQREEAKAKEEQKFINTVSNYTDGFNFLLGDKIKYTSETGKNPAGKFSDLEEYKKFQNIQSRVEQTMSRFKADELTAINIILSQKSKKIGNIEKNILEARAGVIREKSKDLRVDLPNMEEM